MTDTAFGDDDGAADQFNEPLDPDPEQVTILFHEERVNQGRTRLGYWYELDGDNRGIARLIGHGLLERLLAGDDAPTANAWLNRLRHYLDETADDDDETPIIQAVITAMRNEGTLR